MRSALRAGYGAIEVLRGVDLAVGAGEIVALLGSNGAGKSTLNNNVCGLYRPFGGAIEFDGQAIAGAPSMRIVEAGLVQVPEAGASFPTCRCARTSNWAATAAAAPRGPAISSASWRSSRASTNG